MDDETDAAEIEHHEIPVTEDRMLVVYLPPDTSAEVEMVSIMTRVAADATSREASGWQLAGIDTMNLRHAGVVFGLQGSGVETKVAITALYTRTGGTTA